MFQKDLIKYFTFLFIFAATIRVQAKPPAQQICGKWASTEKNLIIEVYREDNNFKARIIWFRETRPNGLYTLLDDQNPDRSLRTRKILGMSILKNLNYNPGNSCWEDGLVYDAKHGREWNASASICKNGQLEVRGYWHFKWIGKTLTFKKVADDVPELKSMRQDRIFASTKNK